MYKFAYIIGDLTLFLFWLVLFNHRKDLRWQIFWASLLFGIGGVLTEPVYTADWWHPLTITGSRVGVEDFLFGFVVGGIASVIFEEIFKKRLKPIRANGKKFVKFGPVSLIILIAIFFCGFVFFHLSSFYSSVFGFLAAILFTWIKRPDLIYDSIFSGFLFICIEFLFFWIPEFLAPDWVEKFWYLHNLSGLIILGVPIEDLIWGFLAALYIGPLYAFWYNQRLNGFFEELN